MKALKIEILYVSFWKIINKIIKIEFHIPLNSMLCT